MREYLHKIANWPVLAIILCITIFGTGIYAQNPARLLSIEVVKHTLVNPGRASLIFFNCMKLFNPNWVSKRWWSAVISEYCSNRWPTAFAHQ